MNRSKSGIDRLAIAVLYPVDGCDCRCVMCGYGGTGPGRRMTVDRADRLLGECAALGVGQVVLSGGEPLLHPDLEAICARVRALGMTVTVLTNGLGLPRCGASLAGVCRDWVVSLDGPEPVHDRIRGVPGAFARLAAGVAALRSSGEAVEVTGRCTVQRENFRHLRETVAAADERIGLDRISFLAVDVKPESFNRKDRRDRTLAGKLAVPAEDLDALAGEVEALVRERAEAFATGFIADPPEKLRRRIVQYFSALHGEAEPPPVRCNAPEVSVVIETDGTVRPCFFSAPVGNAFEAGGLAAVVESPEAAAAREALGAADNPLCRSCVCSLYRPPGERL